MNENTPMSQAQQLFAEEHHNLVYAFLKEKKLPEDEYYDVVIFGYLQAVMFDDDRLRLALRLLQREAANRQILLFTCQHREQKALTTDL